MEIRVQLKDKVVWLPLSPEEEQRVEASVQQVRDWFQQTEGELQWKQQPQEQQTQKEHQTPEQQQGEQQTQSEQTQPEQQQEEQDGLMQHLRRGWIVCSYFWRRMVQSRGYRRGDSFDDESLESMLDTFPLERCDKTVSISMRHSDVGRVVEVARMAMSRGSLAEVAAFIGVYQQANAMFELDDIIAEMQAWFAEHMDGCKAEREAPAVATNVVAPAATAPAAMANAVAANAVAPTTMTNAVAANVVAANATATNAVASCFEDGLLDAQRPYQLCFMLLAMRARHRWMNGEIPAFVVMVKEQYPQLEQFYGKTVEQIVNSIRNLLKKSQHFFDKFVKDQASMVRFIDELYALKKDGTRNKDGEDAQSLAEQLYLRF